MRNKIPENEDTPWVVEMEYEVGKNNEIIYLRIFMTTTRLIKLALSKGVLFNFKI